MRVGLVLKDARQFFHTHLIREQILGIFLAHFVIKVRLEVVKADFRINC